MASGQEPGPQRGNCLIDHTFVSVHFPVVILQEAEKRFKLIAEAYNVLNDDDRRRIYDQLGHEVGAPTYYVHTRYSSSRRAICMLLLIVSAVHVAAGRRRPRRVVQFCERRVARRFVQCHVWTLWRACKARPPPPARKASDPHTHTPTHTYTPPLPPFPAAAAVRLYTPPATSLLTAPSHCT